MKVVKAAIRNSFRRKRPRVVTHSGNYDGPVNLPEGLAAAMRKTHSYMWLDNAVKETNRDDGALCSLLRSLGSVLTLRASTGMCCAQPRQGMQHFGSASAACRARASSAQHPQLPTGAVF